MINTNYRFPQIRPLEELKQHDKIYRIYTYIQTNWIKLCMLALVLYVFVSKDINIQVSMNNGNTVATTSPVVQPEKKAKPVAASFKEPTKKEKKVEPVKEKNETTLLSFFENLTGKKATELKEPSKKELVEIEVKDDKPIAKEIDMNLANTFSNLTFILSPDYGERKNIDPEIVKYKREHCFNYVKRFSSVAIKEMEKYGIPASITLAQGLLESNAGDSRLASRNYNHFGIKCFSKKCRRGHCSNFTDDTHKDFFRKYTSVWESYRAHSEFLQGNRYKHLKKMPATDYKGWAKGLKKAGYATDRKYAEKLIDIIEEMKLYEYDKMAKQE